MSKEKSFMPTKADRDNNLPINKATNSKRIYFPELDGLRFFAFFLVFIHHLPLFKQVPYLSTLFFYGWIGVDLFFALSAFLFTKLLIAEFNKTKTINIKKFYIRRIIRIWPIYFLFILFSVVFFILIQGQPITKEIGIRIFGLFAFSDNIISTVMGYNPLPFIPHLWTIAYEEQFYIFIPIIILILVRSSFKIKMVSLISVIILFNGIRLMMIIKNIPHPAIWVLPITHFESIIMGIVIGFGGFKCVQKKYFSGFFGLIGILLFLLITKLPSVEIISNHTILSYSLIGLCTSFVLFSVLNNNVLKRVFSIKLFVFLGKRSYGLYVYHIFGNNLAYKIPTYLPWLPSNSIAIVVYSLSSTIIISIISYKIIETPFLKLKKKFEMIVSRPI
jgi:peptidoglycan/LPS O-acetylase OafA/YrhL